MKSLCPFWNAVTEAHSQSRSRRMREERALEIWESESGTRRQSVTGSRGLPASVNSFSKRGKPKLQNVNSWIGFLPCFIWSRYECNKIKNLLGPLCAAVMCSCSALMLQIFSFIEVQWYGASVLDCYNTVELLSCNSILLQYYSVIVL